MKKQDKTQTKKKYNDVTEEELLETIEIISKKLAYKFKFGYHEIDDMKQQISVFAIEGLANYDHARPLENFLWTHVRNRLFNYKRDNYQRPDKPCSTCPLFDKKCADTNNNCMAFANKLDCSEYSNWYSRNNSKKNLMYFNTLEDIKEFLPQLQNKTNSFEDKEIISIIEEQLTDENRKVYLKLKHGNKVYKHEIDKLLKKIREILKDD